jgi:hypothetical protein
VNVTQCDNCRKLGPSPPLGWLVIVQQPAEPGLGGMLGSGPGYDIAGTFCRWACLSDYARVAALECEMGGGTS